MTCPSLIPCRWTWYQYVPLCCLSGTWTTDWYVLPSSKVRKMLSERPRGLTLRPW